MLENFNASYYWLILGIFCIAVEALGLSGVGFFFAGLAAICVGVLVEAAIVNGSSYIAQFAWFFGLTAMWALILWRPLRRYFYMKQGEKGYSNIVGDTAIVSGEGLSKGTEGTVIWSGTIMQAELVAHSRVESVPPGGQVVITDLQGNKLIVEPK